MCLAALPAMSGLVAGVMSLLVAITDLAQSPASLHMLGIEPARTQATLYWALTADISFAM